MKRIILILVLAFLWLGIPTHTFAADAGITISPFLQEITVGANDTSKDLLLTVTNQTPRSQDFTVRAIDFGSLDETGGVAFSGLTGDSLDATYGLARWLTLERTSLTLAPGQTDKIKATLVNQPDFGPGGHYAAILLSTSGNAQGGQVGINQTLSSLIFAIKTGGEKYAVDMQPVHLQKTWWRLPSSVTLPIKNTGNVHTRPRGIVSLVNPMGKEVSRGIINQESGYVLPGQTRNFAVDLRSQAHALLPGHYRLHTQYRYNSNAPFTTQDIAFWYIGWPAALLMGVVGALLVWAFRRTDIHPIMQMQKIVRKSISRLVDK